ncbi:MAG: TM2 domain-containing protein [Rhodanobacteraceae bacterium]|nr:TM2 domain-containing protein [Rhodanobacteraceae bacterium]
MKNKTIATVLAFLGGPLGLHRFYLHGWRDPWGWLLPLPTLAGLVGVIRLRQFGVDDQLGWLLAPLLGFTIAGCALMAIFLGLSPIERWNQRFNPHCSPKAAAGTTNWLTVTAVALALLAGTTALMAALAFTFQHYFEYQSLRQP